MKLNRPFIVACLGLLLCAFVGCSAAGTNTNPYAALDTVVRTDTTAVNVATVAIQDGAPASPYGSDLLTGETIFETTLPILEATAVSSAAPTLAADAVTKLTLDGDIGALQSAVLGLRAVVTPAQAKALRATVKEN